MSNQPPAAGASGAETSSPSPNKPLQFDFIKAGSAAKPRARRKSPQIIDLTAWDEKPAKAAAQKPSAPAAPTAETPRTGPAKPGPLGKGKLAGAPASAGGPSPAPDAEGRTTYHFTTPGAAPAGQAAHGTAAAQAGPSAASAGPLFGQARRIGAAAPMFDARRNVERQVREQRAVASILNTTAGVLIFLVLALGFLAGYGGYVVFNELKAQKVTTFQMREDLLAQLHALRSGADRLQTSLVLEQENNLRLAAALQTRLDTLQKSMDAERIRREGDVRLLRTEARSLRDRISYLEREHAAANPRRPH